MHEGMSRSARRQTYDQLEARSRSSRGMSAVNAVIVVVILASVLLAIIETEPTIYVHWRSQLEWLETAITLLFVAEYVVRLWSAAEAPDVGTIAGKRWRYALSSAALFDLLVISAAVAPFFTANLALLRIVRLARIARLARLGRFSRAFEHLHYAVATRAYELLLAAGLAVVLLITGASALYWAEGSIQPDKFGSIPRALWWAAVTLTTIGYGDVAPVTPLGKIIAVLVAVAGIGLVAMPTGILAAGFSEAVQRDRKDRNRDEPNEAI